MRTILWTTLLASSLVVGSSCRENEGDPERAAKKVAEERGELAQAKADLQRALNARIAQLDAKIDQLEAKGDAKSRELAVEFRARRDAAKARLSELATRTGDNWDAFKRDMSERWDRLERDLDAAL